MPRLKTLLATAASLTALSLGACADQMSTEQRFALRKNRAETASKPMLKLECASGCQFDKLELRDPRAVADLPPMQTPTTGWDFANNVLSTAAGIAPWVAVTRVANEAVDALEDRQDRTTIQRGDTAAGDIVGGDQRGDVRGDVRGNTRGDVRGDVRGNTRGDVRGDTRGDVRGDVRGDTAGSNIVGGNQRGDARGDVSRGIPAGNPDGSQ